MAVFDLFVPESACERQVHAAALFHTVVSLRLMLSAHVEQK